MDTTTQRWRVTTAGGEAETIDAAKVAVNDRNGVMMVLDSANVPTHFFREWIEARRVTVASPRWTADVRRHPHRDGGDEVGIGYTVTLFPLDAVGQPVDVDVIVQGGEPIDAELMTDGPAPHEWREMALSLARDARAQHRDRLRRNRQLRIVR
jgi:hypothetical protein